MFDYFIEWQRFATRFVIPVCLLFFVLVATPGTLAHGQDPFDLPRTMEQSPRFERPPQKVLFGNDLLPLWLKALESDSVELQWKAAETIATAKRRGMPKLDPAVQALIKKLKDPDAPSMVMESVARALVQLGAKESVEDLVKIYKSPKCTAVFRTIAAKAIAEWNPNLLESEWLSEALDAKAGNQSRVIAIEGLCSISEADHSEKLFEICKDPAQPFSVRLAAAKGIARQAKAIWESKSENLQLSDDLRDRLVGVHLISGVDPLTSSSLLLKYVNDAEPAVANVAWKVVLNSSEPRLLDPHLEFAINNKDFKIRMSALSLLAKWKNIKAVQIAGKMLDDVHPEVRKQARRLCLEFAKEDDLNESVITAAMQNLDTSWRGIQQAAIILAELDHKPAAAAVLEKDLLDHQRAEVHITVAWLLEQLSVKDSLAPVLKRLERQVTTMTSGGSARFSKSEYEATAHLIQLLGANQYEPMEDIVIRKLIPKQLSILEYPIRPAAIWSLGKIYEGKKLPDDFRRLLLERLTDDDPNNPEHTDVKTMCAFTFGVTGTKDVTKELQNYADKTGPNNRFGFYCFWALNLLTGSDIPPAIQTPRMEMRWFLRPQ